MNPLQEAFYTGIFFGASIMTALWITYNMIRWLI